MDWVGFEFGDFVDCVGGGCEEDVDVVLDGFGMVVEIGEFVD